MAFSIARLKRSTLFVDDGKDSEPLPLTSNREGSWSRRPDETTTDIGLVTDREVRAGKSTVQNPSLLREPTIEAQAQLDVPITSGSRWNKYKLVHKRSLGGPVVAVLKLPSEKDDYLIRKLAIAEHEVLSFCKRRLSHENLCKTHEVFEDSGEYHCVMDPAVITLRHVCRCPSYPSEEQLVAITKQMLAGICYLSSQNLFHRLLNIDNVVVSSDAVVRITKLEYCVLDQHCSPKNAQAFGRTTMLLMDRSAHEQGEVSVRQPHKWSKTAVDFLSSTRTWTPDALLKHDFMQQEWKLEKLRLHVLYVQGRADMS